MGASPNLQEIYRLQRLQSLGVLDSPSELQFDAITKTTAHVLRTPIALINFIDEAREWCKSAWGLRRNHGRRDESLCAQALLTGDSMVIPNARDDPHFRSHPQVTGEREVVFYAGIVLKTSDGVALGTLCAIDHLPRTITEDDMDALRTLAATVMGYLEGRHASSELADARRRLEGAATNRDEFLAMLAHELRAPLAPIQTAVELLDQPATTDAQRAWAREVLKRHTRLMSQIVDDLLSASLVSIGAIDLCIESLRVQDLLDQAVELSQANIRRAGHVLTLSCDETLYAAADSTQCLLILANVLRNATTYTPAGGRINVTVESDTTHVFIRVKDNGVGIAEKDIEDIFQLFRQTGRSSARSPGGMGLGLTLARRLAELHGGSLKASSEGLGRGSEFTLTLRRATPADAAAPRTTSELVASTSSLAVLVVDDNRDTADAMGMFFQVSGHDTRVAYSAADALLLAATWIPDVVLSDIGLPDMDGYALVRALRNLPGFQQSTFVAITGYASDKDRDAALQAGFDAHVPKPADVGKLERFVVKARAEKVQAHQVN
jgi:signal transduction histidine kinase/ActR/RegA family two-component response regulator